MTPRVRTARRTLAVAGALSATLALVTPTALASVRSGASAPVPDIRPAACNNGGRQAPGSTILRASCFAYLNVTASHANANRSPSEPPLGYSPSNLWHAYKIVNAAATRGGDQTIAIVDAFDDLNAESDLAAYRSQYGLPPCTTENGCFRKLNQAGKAAPLPPDNPGWAVEISLDLDMVSAACPNCHIVLVEASTNSFKHLDKAESTAAGLAQAVSNSFGAVEVPQLTRAKFTRPYRHRGVFIVASTGDYGYGEDDYGPQFPSVYPKVTAVGGTSLVTATDRRRGWKESAWGSAHGQGAGSGCSTLFKKPSWQQDSGCAMRMTADVSAVADPHPGVAVYDTDGQPGWIVVGGTSVASPFIAGVVGLAQNGSAISHEHPYRHVSHLYDARGGNNDVLNGNCAAGNTPKYFCHGVKGYDGPTGLGTPHGYKAF